jgi:hypothetical protein
MKTIIKTAILVAGLVLMLMLDFDVPPGAPLQIQMVPQAHAIFGVRRRALRRGVVIGESAAAASEQQHQQAAPAPAPPAAAPAPPPPTATGKPLPLGTVVHALPSGCTSTPVGGVEYYYCGGNFYRAVFQGNSLVYVTSQPK